MKISLIAAIAENGVIGGKDGGIPWKLKWDAEHFRNFTQEKWMLLGRKTYGEMEGWFTTQTPVVLTSKKDFELFETNHLRASTIEAAVALARDHGAEELVISGGASVYESAFALAEELVLTHVKTIAEGPAKFPKIQDAGDWKSIHREFHPADSENSHDATLEILRRV